MGKGSVAKVSKLRLAEDSNAIRDSQTAIANLLDKEEEALRIFEELAAKPEVLVRLDDGAQLWNDCGDMVSFCKELKEILSRVQKRMSDVQEVIYEGMTSDVSDVVEVGDRMETKNWGLKRVLNPPSIIVDDLSVVPKKYRSTPKPIPDWKNWPADKTAIKQALVKEKVQNVAGVHLYRAERLEIKPR